MKRYLRRTAALMPLVLALAALLVASPASSWARTGARIHAPQAHVLRAPAATTAGSVTSTAKFVLHAGLAFGAFHHFIYLPFKSGSLTKGGFFSHKKALIAAALAGLFAYHEMKLAISDVSSSPLLKKLLSPVTALASKLSALASRLKGGHVDASSIQGASGEVSSLGSLASAAHAKISESVPSLSQLAKGG